MRRSRRFLLMPGCLASVLLGALRAGDYRLGAFYTNEGQGYREDTSLTRLPARAFFLEVAGDARQ